MKKINKQILATALVALCCLPAMAQLNGTGYYRVRNAQNDNNYITLANDNFNYSTVVSAGGGASQVTGNGLPCALSCTEQYLNNDIHMVTDDECINPATIIYIQKHTTQPSNHEYNLIGQGTSLLTLTSGTHPVNAVFTTVNVVFSDRYVTIEEVGGSGENTQYTAAIELKGSAPIVGETSLGIRYFVDNEGRFSINESSSDLNAKWLIEPVGHFNVKPEVEWGGKYYATVKVPFAFKLSGQVEKAYVIKSVTDGVVDYEVIAVNGETVPVGTPVILECGSPNAADCQLIPSGAPLFTAPNTATTTGAPAAEQASTYTGENLLKGTYFCNQDGQLPYNNYNKNTGDITTKYLNGNEFVSPLNPQKYVIGITEEGKLGFVQATGSAMPANTAWIETAGVFPWELPVTVKPGDVNNDGTVSIKDVTALIGYLMDGISEGLNLDNADLNEDHDVTIKDVTALIAQLMGSQSTE